MVAVSCVALGVDGVARNCAGLFRRREGLPGAEIGEAFSDRLGVDVHAQLPGLQDGGGSHFAIEGLGHLVHRVGISIRCPPGSGSARRAEVVSRAMLFMKRDFNAGRSR
jgi:hypothetical protein